MPSEEIQKRLRRVAFIQSFLLAFAIITAIGVGAILAVMALQAHQAAEKQRRQIIYLCSVARVLDPIIIASMTNIDNKEARQQFLAAHIVLSQTQPCGEVEG